MFSGIVETTSDVLQAKSAPSLVRISVRSPPLFDDLSPGDSISCDGVCLTVETVDPVQIQFALAAETLQITGWTKDSLLRHRFNLERSLRLRDRVHGHIVLGHVDGMAIVRKITDAGEARKFVIEVPVSLTKFIWQKGSVAFNGVSLTVNQITVDGLVEVCLIPETLRRTNLGALKEGDQVTVEVDTQARGLIRFLETVRNSL